MRTTLEMGRRRLLAYGSAAIAATVAALVGVPIIGFLLAPTLGVREPEVWRRVAALGEVPVGRPTPYFVAFPQAGPQGTPEQLTEVWVYRRTPDALITLNASCTHMQCLVRWMPDLGEFLCPCHGGLYLPDGTNVAGPPPRPLLQYQHRLEAGVLYVSNRVLGSPS